MSHFTKNPWDWRTPFDQHFLAQYNVLAARPYGAWLPPDRSLIYPPSPPTVEFFNGGAAMGVTTVPMQHHGHVYGGAPESYGCSSCGGY